MQFGVFDHVDHAGVPLGRQLDERLRLVEQYDRDGFYAYHVAEHHGTPLGLAPSPNLLLAAIAQRTRRLRFGALVTVLPLYHPVRLIEEIATLDHLSGGRYQLGVGRGASPIEMSFYQVDYDTSRERFLELLDIVLAGLAADTLTYHGEHYVIDDVPMVLKPLQRPHPPLWFATNQTDRAAWAARRGMSIVSLLPADLARPVTDRFRAEWEAIGRRPEELPFVGVTRLIVVADSEREAMASAERAFRPWLEHLKHLWVARGVPFPPIVPADSFAAWHRKRGAFAGTPEGARQYVASQIEEAGVNYLAADFAFGDMTFAEASRSAELFAKEVIPAFGTAAPAVPDQRPEQHHDPG
jgi:alkanesulfonate monooxygenase SsuD/methylene tetrahydromethanopterin reductase-like flavin-dependent oxidoreductase (luciferase family)